MLNEKIDKLINELKFTRDLLFESPISSQKVDIAGDKVNNAIGELERLKTEIEAEKAIDRCSVWRLAINDEIGDCGTDENGKCIGYASNGEPCEECRTCAYSAFEEE